VATGSATVSGAALVAAGSVDLYFCPKGAARKRSELVWSVPKKAASRTYVCTDCFDAWFNKTCGP